MVIFVVMNPSLHVYKYVLALMLVACHQQRTLIPQVFGSLQQRNEHALIQEWVMLSLSNFTQRTPIAMATWSITCFFVCASRNQWLRALYPFINAVWMCTTCSYALAYQWDLRVRVYRTVYSTSITNLNHNTQYAKFRTQYAKNWTHNASSSTLGDFITWKKFI